MKKLCLFFLSLFMLMSMAWAGVKVSGTITIGAAEPAGKPTVKLTKGETTLDATVGNVTPTEQGSYTCTYEFANVDAETYALNVSVRVGGTLMEGSIASLTVSGTDLAGQDVTLAVSTSKIYYRVNVQKKVKDGDQNCSDCTVAIEGATVKVWTTTGGAEGSAATATTDAAGLAAVLLDKPSDASTEYTVKVTKDGLADNTVATDETVISGSDPKDVKNVLMTTSSTKVAMTYKLKILGSSNYLKGSEIPSEIQFGLVTFTDKEDYVHVHRITTSGDNTSCTMGDNESKVPTGNGAIKSWTAAILKSNGITNAKGWAVDASTSKDVADNGNHDIILKKIAAMVTGNIKKNSTNLDPTDRVTVKATKGSTVVDGSYERGPNGYSYVVYINEAGTWTISATYSGHDITTTTVTVAENLADVAAPDLTATVAAAESPITIELSASVPVAGGSPIQLWGAEVTLKKNDVAFGETKYTFPAAATGEVTTAKLVISDNNIKAKTGDVIKVYFTHANYTFKPNTANNDNFLSATVESSNVAASGASPLRISATSGWTAKEGSNPETESVKDLAANWVSGANAGVKLTWDYPAAFINNFATYQARKIKILRKDNTSNAAAEQIGFLPEGNAELKELTTSTLPKEFIDKTANQNGYYNYVVEITFADLPAKSAQVTYGTAPATADNDIVLDDFRAVFAKGLEGAKDAAHVTWNYSNLIRDNFASIKRIELRRKDLSVANGADALLLADSLKFIDATGAVTGTKTFADLTKAHKDSSISSTGKYSYSVWVIRTSTSKDDTLKSKSALFDRSSKAPINAVAVWNEQKNRVDLSWDYAPAAKADWTGTKAKKFEIIRKLNNAAATTVFEQDLNGKAIKDVITDTCDKTVVKGAKYSYEFKFTFGDNNTVESVVVNMWEQAYGVKDMTSAWRASENGSASGVNIAWEYPTELLEGLGSAYVMENMTLERRDMKTATDMATLASWTKADLDEVSSLPRAFFDETAAANGNYNYIITIRYEKPIATVQTVSNINMTIPGGVIAKTITWDAAAGPDGHKGGVKLTWDYPAAIKATGALGTTYKLIDLEIARRDLSTATDMKRVAYFAFVKVTDPSGTVTIPTNKDEINDGTFDDNPNATVTYETDLSKLNTTFTDVWTVKENIHYLDSLGRDKTYNDTTLVNKEGNYAYVFTLRYNTPSGQAETRMLYDGRQEVTLAYSVNDENMGEIEGSPASRAASGNLDAVKYHKGDYIYLKAVAKEGHHFEAWKKGEETVSTNEEYGFIINENVELKAVFAMGEVVAPQPLALIQTTATWNKDKKEVTLSWDYPQAVKDGLGTIYKIQKVDIYRIDLGVGASSKVDVANFTEFTSVEALPKTCVDNKEGLEEGKKYSYVFEIRYSEPSGTQQTTIEFTPGGQANEDVEAASWSVWAHNGVIEMTGAEGSYNYMVFDLNGRVAAKGQYTGTSHSVRVENKGMYIVRRVSVNGVSAKKVMVM